MSQYFRQSKIDAPDVFLPAGLPVTVSCNHHTQWTECILVGIHIKDFVKCIETRFGHVLENVQIKID